ncbi:MAG: hypothetical protein ACRCXM_13045, partial [Beijerinckiaceae bacterium]
MGIREQARAIIDAALPPGKIITSNGATASKYTEMTGLSQAALEKNWSGGGIMTGCNGFTGWYGQKLGSKKYMGVFDLQKLCKDAGKPGAWILSKSSNRPKYGDILRHASFHVDVALDFSGDILNRAAGGQGGKKMGCDVIRRVEGKSAYDSSKLVGWIDIEAYFGDAAAAVIATPAWLTGWWEVRDATDTYYYYFSPGNSVQYTRSSSFLNVC